MSIVFWGATMEENVPFKTKFDKKKLFLPNMIFPYVAWVCGERGLRLQMKHIYIFFL